LRGRCVRLGGRRDQHRESCCERRGCGQPASSGHFFLRAQVVGVLLTVLVVRAVQHRRKSRSADRARLSADSRVNPAGLRSCLHREDERMTATGKPSPLYEVHHDLGATFTEFAGWTMPVRYSSDLAEHRAVRQAAGMFDLSHMGEIEVTGSQAGQALDYAVVGTVSTLKPGKARYTMLCAEDGGVMDDLVVYRLAEDRFLVVANAANVTVVAEALTERAARFSGATVTDRSAEYALIAVQGPASPEIVRAVCDADVDGLKYYSAA